MVVAVVGLAGRSIVTRVQAAAGGSPVVAGAVGTLLPAGAYSITAWGSGRGTVSMILGTPALP